MAIAMGGVGYLRSLNNYNRIHHSTQNTIQKIASGSNYSSASAGASEYANVARLISNIGATTQSAQNAQNISSAIKIAEGATKNSIEGLTKINQYIIDAANDTNGSLDRQALQKNINQQIAQLDSNAYVQFNDMNLLDGSRDDLLLASINGYSRLQLGDIRTQTLGLTDAQGNVTIDVTTPEGIQNSLKAVSGALEHVEGVNGGMYASLKGGLALNAYLDKITTQGAQLQGIEAKQKNLMIQEENQEDALSTINGVNIAELASDLHNGQTLEQFASFGTRMFIKMHTNAVLSLLA